MAKTLGKDQADKLQARLDDLAAASDLEIMRLLPGRCHELHGNRLGQIAVSLKEPYRLIFEPVADQLPQKPGGGLDWKAVTAIRVVEITDYHD